MNLKCDVLVVGGGPAGLATAITTSKAGLKTIVVERSSEIGYPVKTSALTHREVWENWDLPDRVVYQKQDSFYIKSAHSKRDVEVNFGEVIGGTLNYHAFLQELSFKAIKNKTRILLSERVSEPLLDGDFVIGGKTSLDRKIKSKIAVDCSGPEAVIAKKMGLISEQKDMEIGIGVEYEMKGVKVRNHRAIDLYVGREEVVPVGYGWIFPLGADSARVGVCTVYNTPEKLEEKNINRWMERFIGKDSIIYDNVKNAQPYEMHIGAYPLSGMIEKPYCDGLLVAGDAASHASMLFGEGIRYGMDFGKMAGETIIDSINEKDYSSDFLKSYLVRCLDYLGESYRIATELLKVPTDEYWETLIDNLIRLKDEDKGLILKYLKTAMSYEDIGKIFPEFKGKH